MCAGRSTGTIISIHAPREGCDKKTCLKAR